MTHILYHANCCDGFAAACIAHHALHGQATLHPVSYEKPMPITRANMDHHLDRLIFVDFTPPEDWLSEMIDHPRRISSRNCTIIDHHGTQSEIHANYGGQLFNSIFDTTQSGAVLTWKSFFPETTFPPASLLFLQHYDLGHVWNNPKHEHTLESQYLVNYLMRCLPRTPEAWTPVLLDYSTEGLRRAALDAGVKLYIGDMRAIRALVKGCYWVNLGGYEVPALNGIPYHLLNNALHELLQEHPSAQFAAAWTVLSDPGTHGVIKWSLRSRKNGFDCAALCKSLAPNGGGHSNAAGFASTEPVTFI